MTNNTFAAYDNDHVIWGTGNTEEAAIADAKHWMGANGGDSDYDQAIADLTVDPCSPELVEEVKNLGGQISWEWSGTLPRYMQTVS